MTILPPAEWKARAEAAEAKVARVEALAADLERRAKGADRMRRPSSNRWAAEASRLRAALTDNAEEAS